MIPVSISLLVVGIGSVGLWWLKQEPRSVGRQRWDYNSQQERLQETAPESGPDRRRSERLAVNLPVVVQGKTGNKQKFEEETFTISINAHGALLVLNKNVALGETLTVRNPLTRNERSARVSRLGSSHQGRTQVGIEFHDPQPIFWPITVVPATWTLAEGVHAAAI